MPPAVLSIAILLAAFTPDLVRCFPASNPAKLDPTHLSALRRTSVLHRRCFGSNSFQESNFKDCPPPRIAHRTKNPLPVHGRTRIASESSDARLTHQRQPLVSSIHIDQHTELPAPRRSEPSHYPSNQPEAYLDPRPAPRASIPLGGRFGNSQGISSSVTNPVELPGDFPSHPGIAAGPNRSQRRHVAGSHVPRRPLTIPPPLDISSTVHNVNSNLKRIQPASNNKRHTETANHSSQRPSRLTKPNPSVHPSLIPVSIRRHPTHHSPQRRTQFPSPNKKETEFTNISPNSPRRPGPNPTHQSRHQHQPSNDSGRRRNLNEAHGSPKHKEQKVLRKKPRPSLQISPQRAATSKSQHQQQATPMSGTSGDIPIFRDFTAKREDYIHPVPQNNRRTIGGKSSGSRNGRLTLC